MKKPIQSPDDTFLRYLDGTLSGQELQSFAEELRHNAALRERLHQIEELDRSMRAVRPEEPSKNFTSVIMDTLDQNPLPIGGVSIRNGIFLLIGVLLAAGIASVLVSGGVFDGVATMDLNKLEFTNKYFEKTLPSIPFSGKLMVNIIIILNVGLAWLVLDRAILKPMFQRRMQGGH